MEFSIIVFAPKERVLTEMTSETTARICFDIIIFCIFGLSCVLGWKKGLAAVVFSTLRWLICMVVAVIGAYPVRDFLIQNTKMYISIHSHLETTMASPLTGSSFFDALPIQIKNSFTDFTTDTAKRLADVATDTILLVFSFFLILITLLVITKLLLMVLENKDKDSVIGFINGFLGFVFGAVKGALIVCAIMLALFPILSMVDPEAATPVVAGIRQSMIMGLLYDHNPISLFFDMF